MAAWRSESDISKFKKQILEFNIKLVIAMFGEAGSGKSSLINSFLSIFNTDRFKPVAEISPPESQLGCTLHRQTYVLTENITLVDNRGVGVNDKGATDELMAQFRK